MKQPQNNFTTPEQSKKLLALGVPADSADCYCNNYGNVNVWREEYDVKTYLGGRIPCWSAGRLMEIAHICSDSTLSYKEEADEIKKFKEEHKCETLIEAVIACITDAVSIGSINFSKLED